MVDETILGWLEWGEEEEEILMMLRAVNGRALVSFLGAWGGGEGFRSGRAEEEGGKENARRTT